MKSADYRWSNEQIRNQVNVLNDVINPHIILKKATYLNTYLNQWLQANIWIYEDRIVYVGENFPENLNGIEVFDCESKFLVPGYIEPHAHPYQLYNPLTLAKHAGQFGTTTLINDNLKFFLELSNKAAFELLNEFKNIPSSMYWWSRFDGQTEFPNYDDLFNTAEVVSWIQNDLVLQGGELTGWPKLLNGDNKMLTWVQETKRLNKKVEGHFPGASERTLAKLMLLGADCDHEAMTGKDVQMRLMQGYTVSLRNSSIRPDLEVLLKEINELGIKNFDRFFFTTDGSHPYFYENGMTDELIKIAILEGIPLVEAYKMASYNIARYYNIEHLHGSIATGRIANLNILESKENPTPTGVIAKGKWIKKDGNNLNNFTTIKWENYQFTKLDLKWTLQKEDLSLSNSIGINLINNVITKPYESTINIDCDELTGDHDECFLHMIGRDGSWRISSLLKGFAHQIGGFVSSYSGTGDILILGKRKSDMLKAFERMKELGGGIVLVDDDEVLYEISLSLNGIMSDLDVDCLIKDEKIMIELLKEKGYKYSDPAFTLLFLSATHLPFIRVTPAGLFDVKNNKILVSSTKRESPQKI